MSKPQSEESPKKNHETLSQPDTQPVVKQSLRQLIIRRWPEYLLEIIVVIIGITISFWISNIKQNSADRKLEYIYLQGLAEDIKSDIQNLNQTIRQTEKVIQSGKLLITQSDTNKSSISKKEIVALVRAIADRPNFISKNATFSSLKSSANFHLIQDIKLKNLLFEYDLQYQALKAVEIGELQATVFITGPYIIKHVPLVDSQRSVYWLKKLDVEVMLNDLEFVNNVVLRVDKRDELLNSYSAILKTAREIEQALIRNLH